MRKLDMLAFDFGASSGRGILGSFDGNRLTLEEIHRFPNEPVALSGHIFWDILRLYHEVTKGIGNFIGRRKGSLASIGIDSWGVDYCLLDGKGMLLGNPYHYRDSRTEDTFDKVFKLVRKQKIYNETGIALEPFNTLFQLFSESRGVDNLLEKADTLLFISDIITYFLTGVKSTEYTNASTSQLMSSSGNSWNVELLRALNIPEKIMPTIESPGTVKGSVPGFVGEELGITGIPVISVAGHDTASAFAAVPSDGGDYAFISSGTWSLMGVEIDHPVINEKTFTLNYSNERCIGGFSLIKNIMGAWLIQECKKKWEEEEGRSISYPELNASAEKSQAFISFIDPNNSMFYLPGNIPAKIMEFCKQTNQRVPETKGEITRCIYESLALKYRQSFSLLETILGKRINALHIIGGGSNNQLLNQFTANAIKRNVISGPVEATAIGNILVQAMTLGEIDGLKQVREVVRNSFETKQFIPMEIDNWDEAYYKFVKLSEGKQ